MNWKSPHPIPNEMEKTPLLLTQYLELINHFIIQTQKTPPQNINNVFRDTWFLFQYSQVSAAP